MSSAGLANRSHLTTDIGQYR